MGNQARLEARATLKDADFQAGIERMKKGGKSVDAVITNLFKRDKGQRAEHILSGFIQDLTSGNVLGAIDGVASRLSGMGLAAGVGIGVASGLLIKFVADLAAVNKAAKDVRSELATPLDVVVNLSPGDIRKKITDLGADINKLTEARSGFFHKAASFIPLLSVGSAVTDFKAFLAEFQGVNRITKYFDDLAKAEARITDVRKTRISLSSTEADRLDIILKKDQQIAQVEDAHYKFLQSLKDSKLPVSQQQDLKKAETASSESQKQTIKRDAELSLNLAAQKSRITKEEIAAEMQLAEMAIRGSSTDNMKLATMQSHLRLIQDQLRLNQLITKEEREQLELEQKKTEAGIQAEKMARGRASVEKAQMSFDEILKAKFTPSLNIGGRPTAFQDQLKAKDVQRLEGLGEKARSRGDIEGALKYFQRAGEERNEIRILRDSDKDPMYLFKDALAVSEGYLARIDKNTANPPRLRNQ